MSSYQRKTWGEKLADSKGLPKVVKITGKMSQRWGEGTLAMESPAGVDAWMRRVPKGKVTTLNHLRAAIARKHRATIGCPITTGIFAWIAAHAAEEGAALGRKRITPWWRTLKSNGELNPKYPGGVKQQAARLRAEGHKLAPRRGTKPPTVANYEHRLATFAGT